MDQQKLLQWAVDVFGDIALEPEERALRFVEEALEVAQIHLARDQVDAMVTRVFNREPGKIGKEIGQAAMTLKMLAQAVGVSVDEEIGAEFQRVSSRHIDEWHQRQNDKADMGLGKHV